MGLFPATAANMLQMVGVGPFLTIPMMLSTMHGPQALAGWILGGVIATCDGLVWAELGAAMPGTGGSYEYLQQAFGPHSLGRLMGFLFLWQVMLAAPLTAASGGVGFADYARYLFPAMTGWEAKLLAVAVCLVATVLLYRDIRSIGRISTVLWVGLMVTMGLIIWGGAWHFQPRLAFSLPPGAFHPSRAFFVGLGGSTLLSMYAYSGYFTVCLIGGEVKNPTVTIPRSILDSIWHTGSALHGDEPLDYRRGALAASGWFDGCCLRFYGAAVWRKGIFGHDGADLVGSVRIRVLRAARLHAGAVCGSGGRPVFCGIRACSSD